MIVTGVPTAPCTNPYGDYLLSLSMQNKQDYARLHSYEVHLMAEAVTSHIRAGPWQKVGFIQKVRTMIPCSPSLLWRIFFFEWERSTDEPGYLPYPQEGGKQVSIWKPWDLEQ